MNHCEPSSLCWWHRCACRRPNADPLTSAPFPHCGRYLGLPLVDVLQEAVGRLVAHGCWGSSFVSQEIKCIDPRRQECIPLGRQLWHGEAWGGTGGINDTCHWGATLERQGFKERQWWCRRQNRLQNRWQNWRRLFRFQGRSTFVLLFLWWLMQTKVSSCRINNRIQKTYLIWCRNSNNRTSWKICVLFLLFAQHCGLAAYYCALNSSTICFGRVVNMARIDAWVQYIAVWCQSTASQ
jgi:hypothetical protein